MNDLFINKTDFESVRQVAKHVSYDALVPYIRERQNIDFINLLGSAMYFDLLKNKTSGDNKNLLNGSEYLDCNDNPIQHFGLKRVLIHFAYAAYIIEHGYTDTPFGMVQKLNQDSVPVPMGELRNLHDRNIRLGNDYFETVKDFLCHNKDKYPLYTKCTSCNCEKIEFQETRRGTFKHIRR